MEKKEVKKRETTKKATKKNASPKKNKKVTPSKKSSETKKMVKKKAPKRITVKPKKVIKSIIIDDIIEEKKQDESWYEWLKNNIIENEKKYSKEYRNRRLVVALFMIFCFFTVLFSAAVTDYNYAYKTNKVPFFVIKTRDEYKQATVYYGMFYKAWKCDNGLTKINFSRFKTKIAYCEYIPKYNSDGYYINPNGIKISKSQMNIIKNYYFDDYVYFKTNEELENAYKISNEINKIWWVKKETNMLVDNDESISLAIFGKVESVDGVDEWKLQYDDPKYYKCMKNIGEVNVFANYNYLDNTCDTYWETLSLTEDTCMLAQNSSNFVKSLVELTEICK